MSLRRESLPGGLSKFEVYSEDGAAVALIIGGRSEAG